jgi:hypothetical protein
MLSRIPGPLVNIAHLQKIRSHAQGTYIGWHYLLPVQYGREVDAMKKILLATVAILAFTAPSFAQQDKTTGQAPPSGASSFYLAQDTATMKCQVVNAQPAAGGNMKVIGAAHPTQAEAQTALAAEKTCIK